MATRELRFVYPTDDAHSSVRDVDHDIPFPLSRQLPTLLVLTPFRMRLTRSRPTGDCRNRPNNQRMPKLDLNRAQNVFFYPGSKRKPSGEHEKQGKALRVNSSRLCCLCLEILIPWQAFRHRLHYGGGGRRRVKILGCFWAGTRDTAKYSDGGSDRRIMLANTPINFLPSSNSVHRDAYQ